MVEIETYEWSKTLVFYIRYKNLEYRFEICSPYYAIFTRSQFVQCVLSTTTPYSEALKSARKGHQNELRIIV